jgi:hypothetical protein
VAYSLIVHGGNALFFGVVHIHHNIVAAAVQVTDKQNQCEHHVLKIDYGPDIVGDDCGER